MDEEEKLFRELDLLKQEHTSLDDIIANSAKSSTYDQLTLQRLKKRKLWLKDKIAELEAFLYPDIIA